MLTSDEQGSARSSFGKRNNVYDNPVLDVTSGEGDNYQAPGSETFMVITDERQQLKRTLINDLGLWFREKTKKAFTKKTLNKRFPITDWLPKYNFEWAIGDLVAGITVGLTVIPQALAYSSIAGLPPQYGLYGSFLGCFVYIILGSCKDVPIGPTAIASLLTYQATNQYGVEHAILLCFLSGVIQLLMGLLGLGFIIDFVSGPVSSGFTSAVALIVLSSQVKDILAIAVKGDTFLETWISVFENIDDASLWDPILGCVCIVILLLMRKLASVKIILKPSTSMADQKHSPKLKSRRNWHTILNKALWLIGTARNAILVVVGAVIGGAVFVEGEAPPFKLIGDVPNGLPSIQIPPFSVNNQNITYIFTEMLSNMGTSLIIVPLIALLENMAICKAFAEGKPVDAKQELIALGFSNIANSFMQGYPGNGGLARGAVNHASGVRTPFGGLYTGILVILALLFFTPYFFYIPKAVLAAIIVSAVIFMVEIKIVKPIWRSKRSDLLPGVVTFIACLVLPLEYGMVVGVGLNFLFILYHAARPKILLEKLMSHDGTEYLMITPDRCLIFPSVDYVRRLVTKHSIRQGIPVVIDCTHIYGADFTAAQVVQSLTNDFAARNQVLIFYNLKSSVCSVFEGLSQKELPVAYTRDQLNNLLKDKCKLGE